MRKVWHTTLLKGAKAKNWNRMYEAVRRAQTYHQKTEAACWLCWESIYYNLHLYVFCLELTEHLCCVIVNCCMPFREFATVLGWKPTVPLGRRQTVTQLEWQWALCYVVAGELEKCTKWCYCSVFPWFIRLNLLFHLMLSFLLALAGVWGGHKWRASLVRLRRDWSQCFKQVTSRHRRGSAWCSITIKQSFTYILTIYHSTHRVSKDVDLVCTPHKSCMYY